MTDSITQAALRELADEYDRAAVAKQLVDDHDIKLWQRDRMIARFPRKQGFQ